MYIGSNRRVAKNTLFLYMRMLITIVITLYTSRVVLLTLGVEDFGLYNLIGGIIVLFSVLNNAMSSATQRFISYELGRCDEDETRRVFSMSLTVHIGIAILTFILAETVGLWFVSTQLNIPPERVNAAFWVYQFSIFTFVLNIIRVPYNAAIIASEKMSFFAYVSIFEVVLKLIVVYFLVISIWDRLIFYAILMFFVFVLCTAIYKVYCCRYLPWCHYNFFWDKKLYHQLIEFSSWSILGGVAIVGTQQGGNILLNVFYGVVGNAAYGIANQVNAAIYGFVSNFQTAFNPQIVKLYASGNREELHTLMLRTASLSYYLLLILALPFIQHADAILKLWLNDVPPYSVVFCQLMVVYCLIDAIQAPFWMAISASGRIRAYQLWLSALLILNIPISWYLLKEGFSPSIILIVRIALNVISAIVRTIYMKYFMNFPITLYIKKCVLHAFIVTLLSFGAAHFIVIYLPYSQYTLFYSVPLIVIATGLVIYIVGIDKSERQFAHSILSRIITK